MCEGVLICDEHWRPEYDPDALMCRLPVSSERDAAELLEVVGGGGALGAGRAMAHLGVDMPRIRADYEAAIVDLLEQVEAKRGTMSPRALADWVVRERASIARRMRMRQGVGPTVLFEVRDNVKYGPGGRTPRNMRRRYTSRGYRGQALNQQLVRGATSPNTGITNTVVRGARYLKHGGRVIIVFSIATTAYTLLTASEEDLERVVFAEAGGFVGGSLGAGAAVGLCIVFGVATGGWGLLACGIVGGAVGGAGGAMVGEEIYYSTHDEVIEQAETLGTIDPGLLSPTLDAGLVCQ